MNIQAYLKRIDYHQPLEVNEDTLFALHKSHLYSVPFENLDIHYHHTIRLDYDHIYQKIVINRRGGFCYELNSLFAWLLKTIGFTVKMVSARVYHENQGYSPDFDHMALLVNLDEQDYLVDVGFGRFALTPLPIVTGKIFDGIINQFQFDHYDQEHWRVNEVVNGKLVPGYIFKSKARRLNEFEPMCNYHQTSPDSIFASKKLITIPTSEGRITLNNQQLKITRGSQVEEITFPEEAFESKLQEFFNIQL